MAVENCESCGLPFRTNEERGGGVVDNPYCRYCTDAKGKLRSYDAVLRDFTALIVRTQGLAETQARQAASEVMAQLPAWRK